VLRGIRRFRPYRGAHGEPGGGAGRLHVAGRTDAGADGRHRPRERRGLLGRVRLVRRRRAGRLPGDEQRRPRRAAVAALRIVAITPALKLKKWTSADLQVDGAAITKALTDLIASIEAGIAATDEAYGFFGIVTPPAPTPWWELNAPNAQPGPPFLVPGFPYESLMP
jgi:hypothetical protein